MSKDNMPEQPKTQQIAAVDPVLVALADLSREVRGTRADIALVANDVSIVKDRVAVVESRVLSLEEARKTNSMRIQHASSVDLEHEAQLAQEIVARTDLAAKVDALAKGHADIIEKTDAQTAILVNTANAVAKFVATPTVKVIGALIFGAVSSYVASHYGVVLPK